MNNPRFFSMSTLGILGCAVLVYAAVVLVLWIFQRDVMYHPRGALMTPAQAGVSEMAPVRLRTGDGLELVSWYRRAQPGRRTVLFLHGNAGGIDWRAFKVRPTLNEGMGVLLLEWRGFGGNPGQPTEAGLLADAAAAVEYLQAEGVSPGRMIFYGESLGTGVAVITAAGLADRGTPVAALVLETPYTSITDVAATAFPFIPVRFLVKDRFDAVSRIAAVQAPLLFVHAEDDAVIPIRLAKRLFERAAEPKKAIWLPDGGHERTFNAGGERAIREFLGGLPAAPP